MKTAITFAVLLADKLAGRAAGRSTKSGRAGMFTAGVAATAVAGVAFAALLATAGPAAAQTDCPSISQAENGPKGIADGATCEITATGSITSSHGTGALRGSRVERISFNYNLVDNATVTNRGSITSSGNNSGWAVLLNGMGNTFINYGTASSGGGGVRYPAVAFGEDGRVDSRTGRGVVMNEAGGIIMATSNGESPGVLMRGNGHRVENRGSISTSGNRGGPNWQSHGVEQRGNNNTLINEGAGSITTTGNVTAVSQHSGGNNTIIVRGGNITGMHNDADGIFQDRGNITVSGGTVSGGQDGIEVNGADGTITVAGGVVSGGQDGIYQRGNNRNITVQAGGVVSGGRDGIRVQGDDSTVTINGTVEGGSGDAINIIGTGNTVVLEADARINGPINVPGDNTLTDNRVRQRGAGVVTPANEVSNLGQSSGGSPRIGTGSDDRFAIGFTTGGTSADTFLLQDITVNVAMAPGTAAPLQIALYASTDIGSGNEIAQVPTGSALVTFPTQTGTVGDNVFVPDMSFMLSGATTYVVEISAPPVGGSNADYRIATRNCCGESGSTGWRISDRRAGSSGGTTWGSVSQAAPAFRVRTMRMVTPANSPPTVQGTFRNITLSTEPRVAPGVSTRVVDVAPAFTDAEETHTLIYTAASDQTAVATVAVEGSNVTITAVAPGDARVTVVADDYGGMKAIQSFRVTVNGPALRFVAEVPPQNYAQERTIRPLQLPRATGGRSLPGATSDGTYIYSLAPTPALPAGLTYDATARTIGGTTTSTPSSAEYEYRVTDANGDTATLRFRITVVDVAAAARAVRIGEVVLPQVARVMLDATAEAIAARLSDTGGVNPPLIKGAGGISPGISGTAQDLSPQAFAFNQHRAGGAKSPPAPLYQGSNGGLDLQQVQSIAEFLRDNRDRRDWKPMLNGRGFVVPVRVGDNRREIPESAGNIRRGKASAVISLPFENDGGSGYRGVKTAAFWARGLYRDLDGNAGQMQWDGNLFGAHFGFDARVTNRLTLGVAASQMNTELDFTDAVGDGEYELRVASLDPYLGWRTADGRLSGYVTGGGGEGEVMLRVDGAEERAGDVSKTGYGFGLSGRLSKPESRLQTRLKAEFVGGMLSVDGKDLAAGEVVADDELAQQEVTATRARLAVQGRIAHVHPGFVTELQLGVRNDGGDGETGGGAELGWGLEYTGARVRGDARVRYGRGGDAREWGISGGIRVSPGADGQGVSLNLTPAYGAVDNAGLEALWREKLPGRLRGGGDASAVDYALRMNARLGYGIATRKGLLTPFAEMGHGGVDRHRLGLLWKPSARSEWSLTGERDSDGDAVLLKGSVILGR